MSWVCVFVRMKSKSFKWLHWKCTFCGENTSRIPEKISAGEKCGPTCRRRSLVFLVILSMAEFSGSPFSFLPVCEKEAKWSLNSLRGLLKLSKKNWCWNDDCLMWYLTNLEDIIPNCFVGYTSLSLPTPTGGSRKVATPDWWPRGTSWFVHRNNCGFPLEQQNNSFCFSWIPQCTSQPRSTTSNARYNSGTIEILTITVCSMATLSDFEALVSHKASFTTYWWFVREHLYCSSYNPATLSIHPSIFY